MTTPQRILIIVTRRLGDTLLTTPLIRSVRRAYPAATIDVLLYESTRTMLLGNPDIDNLIATAERPTLRDYGPLLRRIVRRYDLAVSTLPGDRPVFYALLAGRRRISIVPDAGAPGRWKRRAMHAWSEHDDLTTHTVIQNLRLADLLGIPRCYDVVPPDMERGQTIAGDVVPFDWRTEPFAVLHPTPKFRYKQWTMPGWQALARHLSERGLRIVITGGPGAAEDAYIERVARGLSAGVTNTAGKLTLAQVALLLGRSQVYVGPDTAITHLAAAAGAPTVALYGPTNPVKWGPWPRGFSEDRSPYVLRQMRQRVGNVLLIQGEGDCVPCQGEGCERHLESYSACLDGMRTERVIADVDALLAEAGAPRPARVDSPPRQ